MYRVLKDALKDIGNIHLSSVKGESRIWTGSNFNCPVCGLTSAV